MDFIPKPPRDNPFKSASILSRIFFWWVIPLFQDGQKKTLNVGDMYDTLEDDQSAENGNDLEEIWDQEKLKVKEENEGKSPSLISALISLFGKKYIIGSAGVFIGELCFRTIQPILLRDLILSFSTESSLSRQHQYVYAAAVSIATLGITLSYHPSAFQLYRISMRIRVALSSLIYRKLLRLSTSSQHKTNVGAIVNLLSNDVNRFDINLVSCLFLPLGVIQLTLYTMVLWSEFGLAGLTGVVALLIIMPIQYLNGKLTAKFRMKIAQRTDERGRVMNEIIMAIRILKMYAWEKPFSIVIHQLRKLELKALQQRLYIRGFYFSLYHSAVRLLVFVTVFAYVMEGHELTASKVFFTTAIYINLTMVWVNWIPTGISGIGEISVSMNRVKKFLLLEEKEDNISRETFSDIDEKNCAKINLKSISASWTDHSETLNDLNISLEGDSTVVIVGPCGSGKSSLLQLLLGEMSIGNGTCSTTGRISYASQDCWVFGGSIKQNIIFGRTFNETKYNDVCKAAALLEDFKQLEHRDETIVGDRGVSLSGGQKARVCLARCLYQDADIYLMDDVLSAVDTKVSRHLFEKCINKYLSGKLRVLVTHQLQYLSQADHVIVLEKGTILAQGTHHQLTNSNVDFVKILVDINADENTNNRSQSPENVRASSEHMSATVPILKSAIKAPEETKCDGAVGYKVYLKYFLMSRSPLLLSTTLVIIGLSQVALTGSDYFLAVWTNAEARFSLDAKHEENSKTFERSNYVNMYTGIMSLGLLLNLIRPMMFFLSSMKIGVNMHHSMFTSLLRAPVSFFDNNPIGRIMNRFTKDITSMDELLPPTMLEFSVIFAQMVGVIVVVIISNVYVTPAAVITLLILWIWRRYYVSAARDVRRIEGVSKSPIFSHCSASFNGLTTIRALQSEQVLISEFDSLQDIHSSAWFISFSSARCFGVWIEVLSSLLVTVISFSFIWSQDFVEMGNVGLALSSAMSLNGMLQYGMRQSAEVENLMTSVERNLEYADLQPEAPLESSANHKPPKEWPSCGEVKFHNVSLSYGEKDVLKNVSFTVKAREKVGVVGRTGAGKSSIIQALFRMTEPRGDIYVDDIRTNEIGLHDLRKNISIIPQDPVLFSGTMRYNLDPFMEFQDDELWKVIEEVELKDAVPALDWEVVEGGVNFSSGERQLVCLGRAILRKNKIIVMDEATANVDPGTDLLIQKKIREKFVDCTIITVAHRLQSVMDCDKILVMDNGYLMEYDHPHILLNNSQSLLRAMVMHMGKAGSAALTKIAKETYTGRRGSFQLDNLSVLSSLSDENLAVNS